jgi:hypothetical protein
MKSRGDLDAGMRAAAKMYRLLRREGVPHEIAFRAAVEQCGRKCPDEAPPAIEAATWEAIQEEIRDELAQLP